MLHLELSPCRRCAPRRGAVCRQRLPAKNARTQSEVPRRRRPGRVERFDPGHFRLGPSVCRSGSFRTETAPDQRPRPRYLARIEHICGTPNACRCTGSKFNHPDRGPIQERWTHGSSRSPSSNPSRPPTSFSNFLKDLASLACDRSIRSEYAD